jgi:hypothetical protein
MYTGANPGFPDMEYRCVGHGKNDPALPLKLPYTDALTKSIDDRKGGKEVHTYL